MGLTRDVKAGVRWLRRFGPAIGLRPDAIGTWGESAGAHLAAFLALNNVDEALNGSAGITDMPADTQAAVAWFPPTGFLTIDRHAPADSLMSHDAPDSPELRTGLSRRLCNWPRDQSSRPVLSVLVWVPAPAVCP